MANVHAAIKQIRKDAVREVRNQAALTELKTLWNKFSKLTGSDLDQARSLAQELASKWDHAVSRGVIPKGRADRKKARIALFLNKLAASR